MDFKDVIEYLMDTTQVSPDNEYPNIKGIRNITIRDINSNKTIYGVNAAFGLYPRWTENPWIDRDNTLRPIQLGLNQFPYLAYDAVKIFEEY
jgi:histidine ammonia-lyase